MPFTYTTDDLISQIKLNAMIPTNQSTFTTERFLSFADDEIQTNIGPLVMSIREDYFVKSFDYTMTTETAYDIPSTAIGMKVKDVYWVDGSGNEYQMNRMNFPQTTVNSWGGYPRLSYYFKDNQIVVWPDAISGQTLRIYFFRARLKLVPESKGGIITDSSTSNIILTNVPTSWVVGDTLNLIQSFPGFDIISETLEITGIGSNYVNLVQTDVLLPLLSELDLDGNWLVLKGDTTIPQLPPEAHQLLAQAVAICCLESLGDQEGKASAEQTMAKKVADFLKMMAPRADAQAKKLTNPNNIMFYTTARNGWGWR